MLAARPAKRRSVSDSDVIVACTAFYTASQLVSICMRCAYFATIGQSFDWREPIGLQERLEGRSSHNGEFSVMSRSRSQGTEVTIVTGDVLPLCSTWALPLHSRVSRPFGRRAERARGESSCQSRHDLLEFYYSMANSEIITLVHSVGNKNNNNNIK